MGSLTECESLVRQGANVRCFNEERRTPLHVSSLSGHEPIVIFLLGNGADVHALDSNGATPLNPAAQTGNAKIISLLIAHGAEVKLIPKLYHLEDRIN